MNNNLKSTIEKWGAEITTTKRGDEIIKGDFIWHNGNYLYVKGINKGNNYNIELILSGEFSEGETVNIKLHCKTSTPFPVLVKKLLKNEVSSFLEKNTQKKRLQKN